MPASAPAHSETSASCVPVATSSGSSRSLPTERPNRTTRVLPNPDTSCASDSRALRCLPAARDGRILASARCEARARPARQAPCVGASPGRSLGHGVSRSALAFRCARRESTRCVPRRRHARPHPARALSDLRARGPRLPHHRRGRRGADRLHQQLHGPALRPLAPGHRRGGGEAGRAPHVADACDRERDRACRGDLRPGAVVAAHPLHQHRDRGGNARHQGRAGPTPGGRRSPSARASTTALTTMPRRASTRTRRVGAPTGRARSATPKAHRPGCCRMR